MASRMDAMLNRADLITIENIDTGQRPIRVYFSRMPVQSAEGEIATMQTGMCKATEKVALGDILITKNGKKFSVYEAHIADSGGSDEGLLTMDLVIENEAD